MSILKEFWKGSEKFANVLNLYFHFSYVYLYLAGNLTVYTPSQGTNRENFFIYYHIKVRNADSGGK